MRRYKELEYESLRTENPGVECILLTGHQPPAVMIFFLSRVMSSTDAEIKTLEDAKKALQNNDSTGILQDNYIAGLSHTQIVSVLNLLVMELDKSNEQLQMKEKELKQSYEQEYAKLKEEMQTKETAINELKMNLDDSKRELSVKLDGEMQRKETLISQLNVKLDESKRDIEEKMQSSESKVAGLDKLMHQATKELSKGVDKRAGVPAGQALSVEERDQLDFFLQSPGIGMIFLSVAFAVSGEDASGALQSVMQKGDIMKMAAQVEKDFPGVDAAEELVDKLNSDIQFDFKKFVDFKAELQRDEAKCVQLFESGIEQMVKTAGADLDIVISAVKNQLQAKSKFFRDTVVPSIVHEFQDNFDLIEAEIDKISIKPNSVTTYMKDLLQKMKNFFASGGYDKLQSDILNSISTELKERMNEKVVHLQVLEDDMVLNAKISESCMGYVKMVTRPMIDSLIEHRAKLWKNIMDCITAASPTGFSLITSVGNAAVAAAAAKVMKDAENNYKTALKKLAVDLTDKVDPILDKIPKIVLKAILSLEDSNFNVEDYLSHQMICYELDYLGAELKSKLKSIFMEKLTEEASVHPVLKRFLDVVTESQGTFSWFWQWWHRNWKLQDKHTKRHDAVHGLKNIITVFMFLFVLLVQFAYLFFVFYELYKVYDGGFCPGFTHGHREDPPYGANKEIRMLVGFVGAYFVMKNSAKLFKFLKALEGNNLTDAAGLMKMLPFANVFMNCPAINRVEKVIKKSFAQLIVDSTRSMLDPNLASVVSDIASNAEVCQPFISSSVEEFFNNPQKYQVKRHFYSEVQFFRLVSLKLYSTPRNNRPHQSECFIDSLFKLAFCRIVVCVAVVDPATQTVGGKTCRTLQIREKTSFMFRDGPSGVGEVRSLQQISPQAMACRLFLPV